MLWPERSCARDTRCSLRRRRSPGLMGGGWDASIVFVGLLLMYELASVEWICLIMLVLFWGGGGIMLKMFE